MPRRPKGEVRAWTVAGEHPAQRLLRTQDVQRGSLRGDGPPTPLQVAAVLHGLADHTHILHMLKVADEGYLVNPAEELPWPGATSLGRYFHGLADYIEIGHEPALSHPPDDDPRAKVVAKWLATSLPAKRFDIPALLKLLDEEPSGE